MLKHPQIEEALLHAAAAHPNLTVWRGARFDGLTTHDAGGATLRVQREGATAAVHARWVVAADGRQSRVRATAGIESPMRPYPYDLLMTYIPQVERWTDTCAQFQGPRGFLGAFIVNGGVTRLAVPLPGGAVADFLQLPEGGRRAELLRRAPLLEDVPVLWERTHTYRLCAHHAPAYHRGRVILLGDAAHTFTPLLGMGMNLAFADAAGLAPLLAHRGRLGSGGGATRPSWIAAPARAGSRSRAGRPANCFPAPCYPSNPPHPPDFRGVGRLTSIHTPPARFAAGKC